jgi:hypothetical protein
MRLSYAASVFKESISLGAHKKYGNEYPDSFTGKEAVVSSPFQLILQDILCRISNTNDRSMALMLGQALDKQSFILDVTKNHRLRDSPTEIYRFHLHGRTKPLPTGVFITYD